MIPDTVGRTWVETPVFFRSGDETLFGIVTEPQGLDRGIAVVHLRDGNQGPSSGRSRTSALLCRRLASLGFHTLRLDYHGVGESTGEINHFRLEEPFREDVEACTEHLRGLGLTRIVLIGECFGARTAISCHNLLELEAVVLIGTPLRDAEKVRGTTRPFVRHRSLIGYTFRALRPRVLREMLHPKQRRMYLNAARSALAAKPYQREGAAGTSPGWVSTSLLRGLGALASRRIPVLFVNGTADPGFEDFQRAEKGTLGEILERTDTRMEVDVLEGRIAACADAAIQEPVIDLIGVWLESVVRDSS